MNRLLRFVWLIAVTSTVVGGVTHIAKAADVSNAIPIAQTENDFGFRLLQILVLQGTPKNIIVSPLSISQALMMTYNGASGSTETSMARTLGVGAIARDQLNAANQQLLQALNKADPDVRPAIASAVWVERAFAIQPAFVKVSKDFYGADVQSLDFQGSPQGAEEVINAWVNRKTQGKIPSIVNGLTPITRLALTDAVYFKGSWSSPFDPHDTSLGDFYLTNGKSVKTPMMTQQGKFEYLDSAEFQAIRMPYDNEQFAMYVFLPRKKDGLREVLKSLGESEWERWIKDFSRYKGTIKMPKFEVFWESDLKEPLTEMGMSVAFDRQRADFAGIGMGNGNLYISKVQHKTYIKVDERGTEAAATNGFVGTLSRTRGQPFEMTVDHPFLFAIAERDTGAIAFIGTVTDLTNR